MTPAEKNTSQPLNTNEEPLSSPGPMPVVETSMSEELFNRIAPLPPVPESVDKGWQVFIDGQRADVTQIVFHNPRVGSASYGYNGLYDTLQINDPGGPVTIPYVYDPMIGLYVGLVQEERPNMGGKVWNVPRGMIDPGETLLEAMERETREETGHHISHDQKPEQLSKGGNTNSTYVKSEIDNPEHGYSVFALRFDSHDLVKIQDDKGVTIGYTLRVRQSAEDADKEKIYDMMFVKAEQALQTRDGFTAAAIGHLLGKLFSRELDGMPYGIRQMHVEARRRSEEERARTGAAWGSIAVR